MVYKINIIWLLNYVSAGKKKNSEHSSFRGFTGSQRTSTIVWDLLKNSARPLFSGKLGNLLLYSLSEVQNFSAICKFWFVTQMKLF